MCLRTAVCVVSAMRDADGNEWGPFEDEYQRRKLRNVVTGQVIDDPRSGDPRIWRSRPAPVDRRSDIERALDAPSFYDT